MKGKIVQWKDDKGFGFIVPESGGEKLFFHISSVKNQARRPQVGDSVLYDAGRDTQGRLKAKGVVIEGIGFRSRADGNESATRIEPVKKDTVDYVSMLVIALSLAIGVYVFFNTESVEKIVPIGGLFIIAVLVLNRQKKPKEKSFICARCKKTENFSKRTIKAWNNGFTKLYCGVCHKKWLRENEEPQAYAGHRGSGGCLGVTAFLILLPVTVGYGVYQWLV